MQLSRFFEHEAKGLLQTGSTDLFVKTCVMCPSHSDLDGSELAPHSHVQHLSEMHPELVRPLFPLLLVFECEKFSDQSQTVTVSERPERDHCNVEDLRTADDMSSHLHICTGEHVLSL